MRRSTCATYHFPSVCSLALTTLTRDVCYHMLERLKNLSILEKQLEDIVNVNYVPGHQRAQP